ncbi:MAG: hypothetical protein EHM12_10825 [Dehalococcoidia bacterium]|nr:MAG: hypothetical protein EHM12_10825 [Dehalococcoidia bacterium]
MISGETRVRGVKNHINIVWHDEKMKICKLLLFLLFPILLLDCSPEVPESWQNLGVPSKGLVTIYGHSDSNGFYADYIGYTSEELSKQIGTKLLALGFSEVCSEFGGMVKGFQNRDKKYMVIVGDLGGKVGLSIFNENGEDPLLYGVCFKGYKLEERIRIK